MSREVHAGFCERREVRSLPPTRPVVHCVTERQAREVWAALDARLAGLGLKLHPDKTRIVYCKDDRRRGSHEHTSFTLLGYTFQPRTARTRDGKLFVSFSPAVSAQALAKMSRQLRRWRLHLWSTRSLDELADWLNPVVRGWMNYYGRFRRSALYPLLARINTYLMRWASQKHKRLRTFNRLHAWWSGILDRDPELFAHWRWVRTSAAYR